MAVAAVVIDLRMLTLLCASESREEGICSQGNDDVIDLLRGKAAEQVAQPLRIRCDPRRGTSSVPKGQSFAVRQNDVPGLPVSVSPPLLNDLQEQRVWKLEQRHVEQPGVVLCLFIHRRWQRGASPFGFRKIVIPSSSLSYSLVEEHFRLYTHLLPVGSVWLPLQGGLVYQANQGFTYQPAVPLSNPCRSDTVSSPSAR